MNKSASPALDSRYAKTVLPNGIRIVTEDIPSVRSISIGVWIDVGSRDEKLETNGITHFIEHMVFKGTQRYSIQKIAQSLESVGGYLNAFTAKEHTCFYARLLDQHLEKSIDVISDLVQHPLFPEKELEKEKQVVIEEIKNLEDEPDDLIHEYFERSLFPRHSLGYPILGTAKNISGFSSKSLRTYMDHHYRPGNMVIAAAGRLEHDHVVNLVQKYFRLPAQKNGKSDRQRGPKTMRSQRQEFEKPITQSHVCIGTIGYSAKSKERYALLVLNTILGEGMSSRLFQNIREKYGFAYTIYSFANLLSDTGEFGVYIGTDKDNIDTSLGLIQRELDKLAEKPVGAAEMKRAKEQVKGSMMLGLESTSSRMMRLGSGELHYREHIPFDEVLRRIDAVTTGDLLEVAEELFDAKRQSIVIFKPAAKSAAGSHRKN
ncbi:MAG TPA: pitrilysin family protein [Bacteroidota bacterium]|nr:pitrilysin family protein [Bacteroidota bacterium]